MNIIDTQYTLMRKAFEIYVSGCAGNPHCEGCHTPWTWDFQIGNPYKETYPKIEKLLRAYTPLIDNIMIFGGEPLDQNIEELEDMLQWLRSIAPSKSIWVFTRYELLKALDVFPRLFHYIDYLKTGAYIPSLSTDTNDQYGIHLATSNQKIFSREDAQKEVQKLGRNPLYYFKTSSITAS